MLEAADAEIGNAGEEFPAPSASGDLRPLGVWVEDDLGMLPRFPHQESFPIAKGLINRYLTQDSPGCLTTPPELDLRIPSYRDLRIALFWLGFGLLETPTLEQPTMHLVPLCKDLDTYVDTAQELGYDHTSSVNSRPTWHRISRGIEKEVRGTAAAASSASASQSSSSSASCQTSSNGGYASAFAGCSPAAASAATASRACEGCRGTGSTPCHQASIYELKAKGAHKGQASWVRARESTSWLRDDSDSEQEVLEEDSGGHEGSMPSSCGALSAPQDGLRAGIGLTGGPSSQGAPGLWTWRHMAFEGLPIDMDEDSYKVKLLHAGGWSSSSGSSEGDGASPRSPRASSSAATGSLLHQAAGGLEAGQVDQFSVTFVSGTGLDEDPGEDARLCTFCLDEMHIGEELCRLPCMHTFHRRCVYAWLARDRRCMLCRLDVTRPDG